MCHCELRNHSTLLEYSRTKRSLKKNKQINCAITSKKKTHKRTCWLWKKKVGSVFWAPSALYTCSDWRATSSKMGVWRHRPFYRPSSCCRPSCYHYKKNLMPLFLCKKNVQLHSEHLEIFRIHKSSDSMFKPQFEYSRKFLVYLPHTQKNC